VRWTCPNPFAARLPVEVFDTITGGRMISRQLEVDA
jgi:hypothetical protein